MKSYYQTIIGSMMILSSLSTHPLLKVGHRGACGYEPDNTLRSFAKAVACGVDMVELDVHVCKSGELVVFHDFKVNNVAPHAGYVAQMSLAELRALDVGKGERIPTLSEVFDLLEQTSVIINIELKGASTPRPVAELIEQYVQTRHYTFDRFIVTSFDHYALKTFRALCPKVAIGALISGIPLGRAEFGSRLNAEYIVVDGDYINQELVDDAHTRGIKIMVYTINDYDDIERMKALGVDGIISNFPDRI